MSQTPVGDPGDLGPEPVAALQGCPEGEILLYTKRSSDTAVMWTCRRQLLVPWSKSSRKHVQVMLSGKTSLLLAQGPGQRLPSQQSPSEGASQKTVLACCTARRGHCLPDP